MHGPFTTTVAAAAKDAALAAHTLPSATHASTALATATDCSGAIKPTVASAPPLAPVATLACPACPASSAIALPGLLAVAGQRSR